jgi:hypothetical protein
VANQFIKGSCIFSQGETVHGVAFLSKGRVLIHNSGAKIVVNPGTFFGINDLYFGRYQSTYIAIDDVMLYIFSINRNEDLEHILSMHKDYHGLMVASNNKLIFELDQIHHKIMTCSTELYKFLKKSYKEYFDLATSYGYKSRKAENIIKLHRPECNLELIRDRISYYRECKDIPIDVVKDFYSYSNEVTLYQLEEQASIINQQMDLLKEMAKDLVFMVRCMEDKTDSCLFNLVGELATEIEKSGKYSGWLIDIMDGMIEEINKVEKFIDRMLGIRFTADRESMGEVYSSLLMNYKRKETENGTSAVYEDEEAQHEMSIFKNSFQTILDYAQIGGDKAKAMNDTMCAFVNMKDRMNSDDASRALRKKLSQNHYEIYKAVFLQAYRNKTIPKVIDMFLKYGYADERLMSEEHLISLYNFDEKQNECQEEELCKVYNIKEWLTLIYDGKKNPSKNEFDQDYFQMLLSMKKQAKLTKEKAKQWEEDPERKLDYEIQNLLRYNNRTTNGQISVFVPVLHEDMIVNDFERLYATKSKVNDTIRELMNIDYSVFDRELLYTNDEKKIIKEYIIKRVYPDIILMPTIGRNGIMWQELSGKKKDSAARFLLPVFSEVNLSTLMVWIFGRFRWELCRSIEGIAWNDIKHKSLTSEYSDYLQFYRRNKELSEEKKGKIKNQIKKGRNNSREIFAMDYEQWINYESKGALKLNKQVREMMATYCPFDRKLREKIKAQPLFAEAMTRYYKKKKKKIWELESRYRKLKREQIALTQELTDTLEYYKEQ